MRTIICLFNVGDGAAIVQRALVFELGNSRMVTEYIKGAILHSSGAHAMNDKEDLMRSAPVNGHLKLVGCLAHSHSPQIHRVLRCLHSWAERDTGILVCLRGR